MDHISEIAGCQRGVSTTKRRLPIKTISNQIEFAITNDNYQDARLTTTVETSNQPRNTIKASDGELDYCTNGNKRNHISISLETDQSSHVNTTISLSESEQYNCVSLLSSQNNDAVKKPKSDVTYPPVVSQEVKEAKRTHGFTTSYSLENKLVDCSTHKPSEITCPLLHLASISSKMHDSEKKKLQGLDSNIFAQDQSMLDESTFGAKRWKLLHDNDLETSSASSAPSNHRFPENIEDVVGSNNLIKNSIMQSVYVDYSNEAQVTKESSEYTDFISTRVLSTFPMKLHAALEKIENDGHADIIGWLSHGRSFKIYKHKEFAEFVLPQYFVMTKKSSFLRQLNLYSFNRISTGSRFKKSKNTISDHNSYYHEQFLRGLPHICKRMKRTKVNGNGIRTAGNPDHEPQFANFPPCPQKRTLLVDDKKRHEIETESCSSSGEELMRVNGIIEKANSPFLITPEKKITSLTSCNMRCEDVILANLDNTNKVTSSLNDGLNLLVSLLPEYPNATEYGQERNKECVTYSTTHDDIEQLMNQSESSVNSSGNLSQLSLSNKVDKEHIYEGKEASTANNFPLKLHRILERLESESSYDIISWLPHGQAFKVHDVNRFVNELMKKFFHQTKYSSFQRQLHMYNFQRITSKQNKDKGSYHHPSFIRGAPDKAASMQRTRVNGKGTRKPGNPLLEPDFYVTESTNLVN
jgi:HSF-type DNA-binding